MLQVFYSFLITLALATGCLATDPSDLHPLQSHLKTCRCNHTEFSHRKKGPTSPGTMTPPSEDVLRIRIAEEPPSLLPVIDPGRGTRLITDGDIYESLVRYSEELENTEPELATSWHVSDDFRTYIFRLDPQATWHDGVPLTASDVAFTLARVTDPAGDAALRSAFLKVSDVKVIDAETVKIELDEARADFLLTLSSLPILPAHVFGQEPLVTHPAARAPVGSGPFRFSKWNIGRSIIVERNANWRGVPPRVKKIEYLIIPYTQVALQLLERQEIDMALDLAQSLKWERPELQLITYPLPEFQFWMFNTAKPLFSSAEIRRAIVMLIDRDAIRCSILACRAEMIEGPWPKQFAPSLGYATGPVFDPLQAKKILKENGWFDSDGDGVRERFGEDLSFSLLLPNLQSDLVRAATVVQQDLASQGVKMRITSFSRGTYTHLLKAHKFDIAVLSVPTHKMYDPWPLFHSSAIGVASNYGSFQSKQLDRLIEQLHGEWEPIRRSRLMREFTLALLAQQPGSFTFRPSGVALARPEIQGVSFQNGYLDKQSIYRSSPNQQPRGNR